MNKYFWVSAAVHQPPKYFYKLIVDALKNKTYIKKSNKCPLSSKVLLNHHSHDSYLDALT